VIVSSFPSVLDPHSRDARAELDYLSLLTHRSVISQLRHEKQELEEEVEELKRILKSWFDDTESQIPAKPARMSAYLVIGIVPFTELFQDTLESQSYLPLPLDASFRHLAAAT
jgi:hypothetical protein